MHMFRGAAKGLGAILALVGAGAVCGSECSDVVGPDLVSSAIINVKKFGTVDAKTGYSFGFVACNLGSQPLDWDGNSEHHPVMAQNLYRLKNGRFEQIGMSWVKHVYAAGPGDYCCTCDDPGDVHLLGVGCSDAYGASLNGNQAGSGTAGGLGPRSQVNPSTGEIVFPYDTQGEAGDAIYKRLQVRNSDLDPDENPGALYFAELQFINTDDAEAGTQFNNVCFEPITVGDFVDGGWTIIDADQSSAGAPAIEAWQQVDPGVTITTVDVPDDGRLMLASKATQNSNGTWHYEYALYNMNSARSVRMFSIPLPPGSEVSNIGFGDIDHHSGEPYDGSAWEAVIESGQLRWRTDSHSDNPNANALRWGTLYNFRFNIDAPPAAINGKLYMFEPGSPNQVSIGLTGPSAGAVGDACLQATEIPLGNTLFSTDGSSLDEPDVECVSSLNNVIWFKHDCTFDGTLRISTCNSADFDTVVAVYSGCSCETFNLIACNNNYSGCDGGSRIEIEAEAGKCYLIQVAGAGNDSGSGTLRLVCADSSNAARADKVLTGTDPSGRFGCAIANAGDYGGDGNGIIIGAYKNNDVGSGAGAVEVVQGSGLNSIANLNGSAGDSFGESVAGSGDVDGDGVDDWIIGAPGNDENGSNAGKVLVYSGSSQALLWSKTGEAEGDRFGWSVACAGDVNEDGFDDVIAGAPWNDAHGENAGRAYVLDGQNGSVIFKINGRDAGDRLGVAVTGLGDLNDDGASDFAIGAPYCDEGGSNSGRVTIYSGHNKKTIQRIDGASSGDRFGSSLAGLTYGSSSKRTLLIIGAPLSAPNGSKSGEARVYMRKHSSPECGSSMCHEFTFNGKKPGDCFGTSVAIGKIVGNSKPDFIVGAPYADENGSASGTFYIFNGSNGSLERKIHGETGGDRLGSSMAACDINGDSKHDLVVGAPNNDAGGSAAGRAYVYFSTQSSLVFAMAEPLGDADLPVLAFDQGDGDLNQDGLVDADDFLEILNAWGSCDQTHICINDIAPLGGDGTVDSLDLMLVLSQWLEQY